MIELCTAALLYAASAGAPGAAPFTVFDAQGAQVELATLCNAMDDADVVFLGELHNELICTLLCNAGIDHHRHILPSRSP